MSWMRAATSLGGVGMVAGVAGMVVWIDDGSNDFGVALASAGFLTWAACALTRVFGASHRSRHEAFRLGRSRGYDVSHRATANALKAPPTNPLAWCPDAEYPAAQYPVVEWDRVVAWMRPWRIPLLACALSLALVGLVVVSAMARPSVPAAALELPSASLLPPTVPSHDATPPLVRRPLGFGTTAAVVTWTSPLASAKGGISPVVPIGDAKGAALLGSTSLGLTGDSFGASGVADVVAPAIVAPAIPDQPAVAQPVTAPRVVPLVASPVVPLTAAEQTAADALAAANLTAANAAAAADLTAANAAAAADLTAANAAAAADLTAANAAAAADLTAANAAAAADLTAANRCGCGGPDGGHRCGCGGPDGGHRCGCGGPDGGHHYRRGGPDGGARRCDRGGPEPLARCCELSEMRALPSGPRHSGRQRAEGRRIGD